MSRRHRIETLLWLLAAGVVLLVAMSRAAGAGPADPAVLERGRLIAEGRCGVCHAVGPEGDSPHPITPPFRQLHRRYPIAMLEEARRTGVVSGHDEMPMFELEIEDALALLAYIDSLAPGEPGYTRAPAVPRAD